LICSLFILILSIPKEHIVVKIEFPKTFGAIGKRNLLFKENAFRVFKGYGGFIVFANDKVYDDEVLMHLFVMTRDARHNIQQP